MIKRILLLSTLCLAFTNNNQASQLKMPSLPFSKLQATLGLAGLATACCAGKLGYDIWYNRTFMKPYSSMIDQGAKLVTKYDDLCNVKAQVRLLLSKDVNGSTVVIGRSNPFFDIRQSHIPRALIVRESIDFIEEKMNKHNFANISAAVRKIKEHCKKDEQACCTPKHAFNLCHSLKTDVEIIDFELANISANLENEKKQLDDKRNILSGKAWAHRWKMMSMKDAAKQWGLRLAACGAALYGATRLLSWYKNR